MVSLLTTLNWLLPLLYLAVAVDYGLVFFLRRRMRVRNPWLPAVIAVHAGTFALRGIHAGSLPLMDNYDILSAVAGIACLAYWLGELVDRDRRAGVFVFALIFTFQYTASMFADPAPIAAAGQGPWARLHILPAIAAYTAGALAAIYGLLLLLARRNLKRARFGLLFDRLPPVQLLGRMTWLAMTLGLGFLTVSIITGVVSVRYGGAEQVGKAKILAKSLIGSAIWLIYAIAVAGRLLRRWPVARVAVAALAGFVSPAAADRVLAVAGNCDSAEIDSRLDALGVGLLGRGVIHDEIGFHGLSAMPPWRRRMYHFTEDQLAALLQEGYAQIAGATRHVVLSHAPPRNNKLDRTMFFENVGSVALRDFVDRTQPDLVICGHIHEGRGIGSMGKTTVVNCGPGAAGSYALVEVGETIQVELRRA